MLTQTMPALINALSGALPQNVIAQITQALGNCNQPITHRSGINVQPANNSRFAAAGSPAGSITNNQWDTSQFDFLFPSSTDVSNNSNTLNQLQNIINVPSYQFDNSLHNYAGSQFNFPTANEFVFNNYYGGPTNYYGGDSYTGGPTVGFGGNNYFDGPTSHFGGVNYFGGTANYFGGNTVMGYVAAGAVAAKESLTTVMNGFPAPGSPGAYGPSGPAGVPGASGVSGGAGLPGFPGGRGPAGGVGIGSPGIAGLNGIPGLSGMNGFMGAAGFAGAQGLSGRPGSPGASALPGGRGMQGTNGRYGRDGSNGAAGGAGRGFPGPPGPPGLPGPGADLNPVSAPFLRATPLRATGTLGTASITIPTTGTGTILVPKYKFNADTCTISEDGNTSVEVTVTLSGGTSQDVVNDTSPDLDVGPLVTGNALTSV